MHDCVLITNIEYNWSTVVFWCVIYCSTYKHTCTVSTEVQKCIVAFPIISVTDGGNTYVQKYVHSRRFFIPVIINSLRQ